MKTSKDSRECRARSASSRGDGRRLSPRGSSTSSTSPSTIWAALRGLIEYEALVEKRRDLVVDGYPYTKLSFIKEGMAARYRVLRNGKRQIVDVLIPGDVVGLPGSFRTARRSRSSRSPT